MISQYDMGSGQPIREDDVQRPGFLDPSEPHLLARLTTVEEAATIERERPPAPAAVLTVPIDELLARVSGS